VRADGQSILNTAKAGKSVELFCVSLYGEFEQLTDTAVGSIHYSHIRRPLASGWPTARSTPSCFEPT